MNAYQSILLLTNPVKDPQGEVAAQAVNILMSHAAVHVYVRDQALSQRLGCEYVLSEPDDIDLVIVIGGDGSVLDASLIALEKNVPLLGINMGHLGYLAEIDVNEMEMLEGLFDGRATVKERMTLALEIQKAGGIVHCDRLAVNEVAFLHADEFGLSDLTLTDGAGNRARYHGDGLIVATPAGSTGYSFSAGGPILSPNLDAICITPICAHSFFNRAMVIGGDTDVKVTNTTHHDEHVSVCVDGRKAYVLDANESAYIYASEKRLKMIFFGIHPTFNTLRRKMELSELKD